MTSPKILVVEDDEPVASMLCFVLQEEGYRCVQAGTAEDGWAAVLEESPGGAIVDLRLPGKDGWWLIRRIRNDRHLHRLPIVLITGYLDEQVVAEARKLGCVCLGKPFSFPDLSAGLERANRLAGALPEWRPKG